MSEKSHKTVSISMKVFNLCMNAKDDIAELKHLSPSKIIDIAALAGIEAMLRKQEGLPPQQ